MSVYPFALDSDETIIRIDDNISELGTEVINQQRDAIFNMQEEMGLGLSGALSSLADRLAVSINANGTIKASALTAIGLATLPITNVQVASNAGIDEYKLALDYSTSDLNTAIQATSSTLTSLVTQFIIASTNFIDHLLGTDFLVDGTTSARHVASHIDLNTVPTDTRYPTYTWTGLLNKAGILRSATHVASALLEINNELVAHENATADAHVASAITVDTSNYKEIPTVADTAQKVFDYFDQAEIISLGNHRATQHANGVPATARVAAFDGYEGGGILITETPVQTFLDNENSGPLDSVYNGDNLVSFKPSSNVDYKFDALFSQIKPNDKITINYGNGIEAVFIIDSIRYIPGTEWTVKINGNNLFDSVHNTLSPTARVERTQFDTNTYGVLAVAACNAQPSVNYSGDLYASLIIGSPRGASALGIGFDAGQLDSSHYNLYLEMYPTGNPVDYVIKLPVIDVTGNAGATPGLYTLDSVVQSTNDAFRAFGFNYRFIAFATGGEFGIMIADAIDDVSFAIITGDSSSGTLAVGTYLKNVMGGSLLDDFDALGFGSSKSNQASPAFHSTFTSANAARLPTKVITPFKQRFYNVNGIKRDTFGSTIYTNADGYWPAVTSGPKYGLSTSLYYTINLDLRAAKLKIGKTVVIQPIVPLTDPSYDTQNFGRFIIDSIIYAQCDTQNPQTVISVVSSVHATGSPTSVSLALGQNVRVYLSEDSVGLNYENVIDSTETAVDYNRLHEVCIDKDGITFAHERARLTRQSASATKIATNLLHIKSVSPKLRGYFDASTDTQKYIRFYVLSYDLTSGEFDGYLCQRPAGGGAGALRAGTAVTGRKGLPVRVYDETNVDYIEFEFDETATPGIAILPDVNPRFVDIELFPSMMLNDEVMTLATCEVNWSPEYGKDIVQNVKDTRQFGSVSEVNFTNSAKDYITAGDRLLHSNGIICGLEFDSVSVYTREAFFKGGSALVNGKIVTINNSEVTLPRLRDISNGSANIVWAICVNEFGKLEPIVITSSKDEYFATSNGVDSYYVPSATFAELVAKRKDLTPIALATVIVGTYVLNASDIKDVRRFVKAVSPTTTITWSSGDVSANFNDFSSLKNWVNNYLSGINKVTVRGAFTIDSEVDMTGFNYPVVLDGDGALVTVNSWNGFKLGSNVTLKNFYFIYDPPALTADYPGNLGDRPNRWDSGSSKYLNVLGTYSDLIISGGGCVYVGYESNFNNIKIIDCMFESIKATAQRPPFIGFELGDGYILSNVTLSNNNFKDLTVTTDSAAISIVGNVLVTNTGNPSVAKNIRITNNVCNDGYQGIYLTSMVGAALQRVDPPGLNAYDVIIADNSCGVIGYLTTSVAPTYANAKQQSLTIKNNNCAFIGTMDGTGLSSTFINTFVTGSGTGNVNICNNYCHWIHIINQSYSTNKEYANALIEGNTLTAYDFNHIKNRYLSGATNNAYDAVLYNNTAILVSGSTNATNTSRTQILDNNIDLGNYNGQYYYYHNGIATYKDCKIVGNIIKGILATLGRGMLLGVDGATNNVMVKNNVVSSPTIKANISATDSAGNIADNVFDAWYSGQDPDESVVTYPYDLIIERNKTQPGTYIIPCSAGQHTIAPSTSLNYPHILNGGSVTSNVQNYTIAAFYLDNKAIRWNYTDLNSKNIFYWRVYLKGLLPENVIINNISVTYKADVYGATDEDIGLFLRGDSTDIASVALAPIVDSSTNTISTGTLNHDYISSSSNVYVQVYAIINHSGNINIDITDFTISYNW